MTQYDKHYNFHKYKLQKDTPKQITTQHCWTKKKGVINKQTY